MHQIIKKVEKFCDQETRDYPDQSHNLEHHQSVAKNAMIIAMSENIRDPTQLLAIQVGALVHDIVDYKYCSPTLPGFPVVEIKQARLEKFLSTIDELQEWVPRILLWIRNMSYSLEKRVGLPELDPEDMICRNILSDADKWEALGAIGIQRCWQYHKMLDPEITDVDLISEICDHIEEKLFTLSDYCRTKLGQEYAQHLTVYIREWYSMHRKK